jgi:hypothetical protein
MSSLKNFYVDNFDNIWIGTTERGIIKIDSNGVYNASNINTEVIYCNTFIEVDSIFVVGSYLKELGYNRSKLEEAIKDNNLRRRIISNFKRKESTSNDIGLSDTLFKNEDIISSKDRVLTNVSWQKGVVMFDFFNKFVIYNISQDLISCNTYDLSFAIDKEILFCYYSKDYLWFSIRQSGVYKCVIIDGKIKVLDHYFPSNSISSISQDNSKGYWFTTLKKGVYYISNSDFRVKEFKSKSIYHLEVDTIKEILFTNFKEGECNALSLKSGVSEDLNLTHPLSVIGFDQQTSSLFWYGINKSNYNRILKWRENNIEVYRDNLLYTAYFKDFILDNDTIYLVNDVGLHIFADNFEYTSSLDSSVGKMWCTSILRKKNKLWIGTSDGVKFFKSGKITAPFQEGSYFNSNITCIENYNDSIHLLGTKNSGIIVVINDKIDTIINNENGLISNLIRTLHVDNKGTIWAGTSKGVSRIRIINRGDFNIFNLTKNNGLPSEEIVDIKSLRDTIYIATSKGLLSLNKNKISINKSPPKLYAIEIKVNSKVKSRDSLFRLNHFDNNLSISYLGVSYRSQGKVNYKYRLIGAGTDTSWVPTQSRLAQYTLLPYGSYTFEVKARNEDGFWSLATKVPFTIYPPYWKTWWFIGLIITGSALSIFWITYSFFRRREQKVRTEKKLIELELKALRSQMNPHFIFNVLNAIQHFMLQNNFKETNHYLTQFAKLVRTVLNLSEKNIITIGEEVELLRLYMNLEKMRFENGFDYEIILGEEIDEDYDEIPSMLIQPYVENAIWHGLMNKKEKGFIQISINIIDGNLCCVIEDNGIGIKKGKAIKSKRKYLKHKSVGMRITKDRLDILNDKDSLNISILDLELLNSKKTGTRVEINLPYNN